MGVRESPHSEPGVTTLQPDGKPFIKEPRITAVAYVNDAGAKKLFAGAPTSIEDAIASIVRSEPKSFALPVSASITVATTHSEAKSENVVGKLKGAWSGAGDDVSRADGASGSSSASADRSTAIGSTTAPTTTPRAARSCSKWRGRSPPSRERPKRSVIVVFRHGGGKGPARVRLLRPVSGEGRRDDRRRREPRHAGLHDGLATTSSRSARRTRRSTPS